MVSSRFLEAGISMIEAVVAIAILAVVSSAIILVTLSILSLAFSSRLKNQAVTYSQQLLEQTRDFYQSSGWAALYGKARNNQTVCYVDAVSWSSPNQGVSCDTLCQQSASSNLWIAGQSIFYRYLALSVPQPNQSVKVSAVTVWKEKGGCRNVQVDTYYFSY